MRRVLLIFPAAPVAAAAVEILFPSFLLFLRCAFFYFPLSFAVCLFLCAASGSQWQYFQFAKWRIQPTEMPHIVLITYSRVLVAEQSRDTSAAIAAMICDMCAMRKKPQQAF